MEKFKMPLKFDPSSVVKEMDDFRSSLYMGIDNSMEELNQEIVKSLAEKEAKEQERVEREVELNKLTKQIVQNTAYLPELVGLIRKNNEVNEEMLDLMKEMTDVLKAQTVEEAESVVKDIVTKAKDTKDGLDAMSGLLSYGKLLIKLMFPES